MDNLNLEVEKILKINDEEQKSLLRHLPRLSLEQRFEIFPLHNSFLHKLRQKQNIPLSVLSYAALILAIEVYVDGIKELNKLNITEMSLDEIREISSKKAKVFLAKQYRVQSKREKLISYWSIVVTLRKDEKYSFRQISAYLKKYHKFEISYNSIYAAWQKLENNKSKEK